jgi:predicted enzyme related to lactoylglutathione lyase
VTPMVKFDHLVIPVSDLARSRAWYVETFGLAVEFEVAERRAVALQDTGGFTIFLQQSDEGTPARGVALYFQVDAVDTSFQELSARGVAFSHPPTKTFWGYGAELADPDGYLIRLWDERSMKER